MGEGVTLCFMYFWMTIILYCFYFYNDMMYDVTETICLNAEMIIFETMLLLLFNWAGLL